MKNLTIPILAGAALATTLWFTIGTDDAAAGPTGRTPVEATENAANLADRSLARSASETLPTGRDSADIPIQPAAAAAASTTADDPAPELAPAPEPTEWISVNVLGRTRTAPAGVDVAALEASDLLNPNATEFSAELREALAQQLEQLSTTHARLSPEIARIEKREFAQAAQSGYAVRTSVEIVAGEHGSETIDLPIGVFGEESEVVFDDEGAQVVRVPTRLMRETNSLRAAWLGKWLEFWHTVLPKLEQAGHLDASSGTDAIYEAIHGDFERIVAGYEVSLEDLQARRKKG